MISVKRKLKFIFLLIIIQAFIGVSIGLTGLFFVSKDHIAPNVYLENVFIGNMEMGKAAQLIEDTYGDTLHNQVLHLKYNQNKEFAIDFSALDAALDVSETLKSAYGEGNVNAFLSILQGTFSPKKRIIHPVLTYNEGKLREKMMELATLIHKGPVNANIQILDGKVLKKPEVDGYELNIDLAVSNIGEAIRHNSTTLSFGSEGHSMTIETIKPKITLVTLNGLDEVISQYSTKIQSAGNVESVKLAAYCINKVGLFPADPSKGLKGDYFYFNKSLKDQDALDKQNNDGYNIVASTLYAAILTAGIKSDTIVRTPNKSTTDYIQPGLDAIVLGDTYDFSFQNTLEDTLMIYTQVEGNKLTVSIISKKKNKPLNHKLTTEIIQRFEPTTQYMENQGMKQGEKRQVSPGKEGMLVKVFLVTQHQGEEIQKQFLHDDNYSAIKAIVEIGPNTNWQSDSTK